MPRSHWLRWSAIGTWTVCGLPAAAAVATGALSAGAAALWTVAFVGYGAALVVAIRRRESAPRLAVLLIMVQSATAITATYLTRGRVDAAGVDLLTGVGLLVIVAAELPHLVRPAATGSWIVVQTLLMSIATSRGLGRADFLMFYFGSAGFQMFASMSTALMLREAEARADLARANAELHATRQLLAESSRASERLRIARDLHDTIGHHLTALSLQLDVASRLTHDAARDHVSRAHAITRLLLAEVRSVVSEMREGSKPNLVVAIRTLASASHTPAVHFDMPEQLVLDDEAQALSLVRCVQEIITNTTRHANARNLWITIEVNAAGVVLHARDDGRGAASVTPGNGLTGMRERFAEYSGRIDFGGRPGEGFEIHGVMPVLQATS